MIIKNYKKLILFLLGFLFLVAAFEIKAQAQISRLIVSVNIPKEYKQVFPGEQVMVETEIILERDDPEKVDIIIEYTITDENKTIIYKAEEIKGTIARINYVKFLFIWSDIEPNVYSVNVKVRYEDIVAIATTDFEVIENIEKKEVELLSAKVDNYYNIIKVLLILQLFILCLLAVVFWNLQKGIKVELNGELILKKEPKKKRKTRKRRKKK